MSTGGLERVRDTAEAAWEAKKNKILQVSEIVAVAIASIALFAATVTTIILATKLNNLNDFWHNTHQIFRVKASIGQIVLVSTATVVIVSAAIYVIIFLALMKQKDAAKKALEAERARIEAQIAEEVSKNEADEKDKEKVDTEAEAAERKRLRAAEAEQARLAAESEKKEQEKLAAAMAEEEKARLAAATAAAVSSGSRGRSQSIDSSSSSTESDENRTTLTVTQAKTPAIRSKSPEKRIVGKKFKMIREALQPSGKYEITNDSKKALETAIDNLIRENSNTLRIFKKFWEECKTKSHATEDVRKSFQWLDHSYESKELYIKLAQLLVDYLHVKNQLANSEKQ